MFKVINQEQRQGINVCKAYKPVTTCYLYRLFIC
jgi:hypothetical protein